MKVHWQPETEGLVKIDWKQLSASTAAIEAAGAAELIALVDGELEWRMRCPTCYTFIVPSLGAAMAENFSEMMPEVLPKEVARNPIRTVSVGVLLVYLGFWGVPLLFK